MRLIINLFKPLPQEKAKNIKTIIQANFAKVAEDLHNIFVPDAVMLGTAIKVVRYVNCTDPFESR